MDEYSKTEENIEDAVNPCPPEWLDREDNALLRGDAIGDTVYTHRWVLKCLFTITKGLPKYICQNNTSSNDNPDNNTHQEEEERLSSNISSSTTKEDKSEEVLVVELDSEVEDAACQLWDMTVERDVSLHLLNLEEIDILHLSSVIFDESYAPRLTEVMVGVVANLCCIEESCEKVLKKESNEVLVSALHLVGSTSDVPTLCEVMRLIRLLLWHRTNRTPNTSWASCPLLKLLCQAYYRNSLTFLLKNSLSDTLICSLLELLSNFLFICLPEIGLNVASLYSTEEIISGLVEIFDKKNSLLHKHPQDEQEKILHLAVMCLYSFIDTPGTRIIQSFAAAADSKLESLLNSYMENEGRVESLEQLEENVCDHLIHAVGVSQLMVPHIRQPSLIMTVGKLMALIQGETRQYSVSRSSSREERGRRSESDEGAADLLALSESLRRRIRRESAGNKPQSSIKEDLPAQISNPLIEECGWVSPPPVTPPQVLDSVIRRSSDGESAANPPLHPEEESTNPEEPGVLQESSSFSSEGESTYDTDRTSSDLEPNLKELKEILEDYCYQLIAYWWSLSSKMEKRRETRVVILDVLDQCHAHEVLFILKAVRVRDPSLVPRLQEQILDLGSHQRLVVLLAHMYQ